MKSPGNSGPPPDMPTPQGRHAPYGQASQFNPQYQSFLPTDQLASAQLGDPTRQEFGAPTELLKQQQAQPMMAQAPQQDLKGLLAALMSMPKQKKRYEGSGSHGGGRG